MRSAKGPLSRPKKVAFATVTVVVALLVLEGAVRLTGRPDGRWRLLEGSTLYPPSMTEVARWGPIPYVVKTNALGLRGPEVRIPKPAGTRRVLCLGDSVTDGFFVDGPDTFPAQLEAQLHAKGRADVDVVNGATGGGAIDREFAALRALTPLIAPDVVILTFCTNDIADVALKPLPLLVNPQPWRKLEPGFRAVDTALGELVVDLYVRLRSRAAKVPPPPPQEGDPRYAIAGGDRFAENARLFRERFATTDGLVVGRSRFEPEVEAVVARYEAALDALHGFTVAHGQRFVLVYFPAYPEVYGELPMTLRDRLAARAAAKGFAFLDLTPALRAPGGVLHLAPVDFHLNPRGNATFAAAVGAFLEANGSLR